MNTEVNLDKPFETRVGPEFLNKAKLQGNQAQVTILKVMEGSPNRPLFLGVFKGPTCNGEYMFDLCNKELQKILEKYGNIPRKWIGIKLLIYARPYRDGKSRMSNDYKLRLHIEPL